MFEVPGEGMAVAGGRVAPGPSTWAFRATLAAFVAASIALAWANRSPGSADSCANLTLARNVAQGRGYVSFGVGQLWVPQPIPSPETIKPPGLAYLTAALFAAVGTSLAVPVVVNAVAVASNALFLRTAVSRTSGQLLGDLAGLLILLSRNYEMVSLWNNNILAACHSLLILLASGGGFGLGGVVALAACSAFGSLMKPTFLLGAVPFAILVLGRDAGASRGRRASAVAGFLALFAAMTAPYWLTNVLRYGDPLYAPGFTSGRLAVRYDVLGAGTWRTVRFGRPMTYGEVARTMGVPAMLLADARMIATTAYYAIALNPAVAALAAAGPLFRGPGRWRDHAGPAVLAAAVGFEVGVYNHHEARYLWPVFPCLLALAALATRDFSAWGLPRLAPDLAGRFRVAFVLAWTAAVGLGGLGAVAAWRGFAREARTPIPTWVEAVSRLPADAVILVADVPSIGWWTGRSTVLCPSGARDGLEAVVALYRADHYLATAAGGRPAPDVPFRPEELIPVARGDDWGLYRIAGPIASRANPRRDSGTTGPGPARPRRWRVGVASPIKPPSGALRGDTAWPRPSRSATGGVMRPRPGRSLLEGRSWH